MSLKQYNAETIRAIGYTIKDSSLKVYEDKLYVHLLHDSGSSMWVWLKKDLREKYGLKEQYLTSDLVVSHYNAETDKAFFIVENRKFCKTKKKAYSSLAKKLKLIKSLPCKVLDKVLLNDNPGVFTVAYLNADVLVLTNDTIVKAYNNGKRTTPIVSVSWNQFKSVCHESA